MVSPPFSVRPALRTWFVCSVLFAVSVLLFSRAADYGFSNYDDPTYVTNNPHVQAGLTWPSIVWAFTAPTDYWHPLTWLSHMLDCELFGDDAYGHHLTSLLWHAANAVLAFFVFRRLTGAYWTSAFAAALFAWHPLRVESVVWITERKDVMSGFFFLLTLLTYTRYAELKSAQSSPHAPQREPRENAPPRPPSRAPLASRAPFFYALTLAGFIAGLMSKPMLVTLPVVLLILDFWPLRRLPTAPSLWQRWRGLVLEKLPFFALSAAASLATIWMQRNIGAFRLELPLDARVANAFVSIARYLGKFFRPLDLTVFYPHPGYWPPLALLGAVALTVALTVLAWQQRRTRPWILAGWLGFLVMLSPAIGILQVGAQSMADRYTYLPILGVQLALLWTFREGSHGVMARRILAAAAVLVLAACLARTWDQQATWRDPAVLFQHSVAIEDRNEIGHALLAYTLLSQNRIDEAEHHTLRALALNAHNDTALFTLAEVRERQRRFDEAEAAYRASLAAKPSARTGYQLGELLLRLGRTDEGIAQMADAIRHHDDDFEANLLRANVEAHRGQNDRALVYYQVALAADPDNADAHLGAGVVLNKLGRAAEARAHFQSALAARPDFAQAHAELGLAALAAGEAELAATHLRAAVQAEPLFAVAHLALGRAAEKLGRVDEATASFEQALRLTPNDPVPHRVWADVLARRQQFAQAIHHYERAAELEPRNAETHAALGFLLVFTGRRDEGIARWQQALRLNPDFPGLRQRLEQLR